MTTNTYIKLYQVEDGVELQNRVTTIENMLDYGDFEVNEMNAINGVIQENFMVGYTDNTDLCSNLMLDISGKSLFRGPVQIIGDTIFGKETDSAEEVSNNDTNLYVYGDLRIMDGGNIIIEDISNTTVTELRTEVKITDSIDISNDGTTVAMIVNQLHTVTEDIVHFQDNGQNVFTIGSNGKTFIKGDVSMESSLEISDNLTVHNELLVDNDASFGSHLQVVGDVSMESSLEISDNLIVHNEMMVDNDASFGSHLQVVGDVSMESSLEIFNDLIVHNKVMVDNDASFGSHLQVVGDVSMESSLEISNDLLVHNKMMVDNDASFGSHLQVVGDVSMESSLEISNDLIVHNEVMVDNDASFGSHLQVVGDVSMESSLEISNDLLVHNKVMVDNDASFGSHLQVVGDVSMESSLEISDNLIVHNKVMVDNDASFGSHLQVVGDVSMESSLEVFNNIVYNGILYKGSDDIISTLSNSIDDINTAIENITGGSGEISLTTLESKISDITNSGSGVTIIDGDISINNQIQGNTATFAGITNFENNVNIGTADATDISLVLYGDLRIKAGGSVVVEDSSFSITDLQTEVKITDILNITNNGTGPALTVEQDDTYSNDIVHFKDSGTDVFVIGDGGNTTIHGSLDISGTISSINTQLLLKTDSTERIVIDSFGAKFVNSDPNYTALDISSTSALGLPVGTSSERPIDEKTGHIRYNTTNSQFEGYGEGVWQGLGGVIDIDQDTKITTDDNNNLIFDTSGSTRMTINNNGDVSMSNEFYVGDALVVKFRESGGVIKGVVGIGTDDPSQYVKLHVNGWAKINYLGLGTNPTDDYRLKVDGNINCTGTLKVDGDINCTGTLYADSDIKVKKNLVPLDNALDKISNLNGYYYHKKGEEEDSLKHIGVIAQEVEAEYPELVSSNTDIKSVNYDGINAILIECVKELRKENLDIRKENLEIKREIEEIKLKMNKV